MKKSVEDVPSYHIVHCISLYLGVLKISLYSPAGGYLCYLKFAHSSTQTKPYIKQNIFLRMVFWHCRRERENSES